MARIFYWVGEHDLPSGGEKHAYEHVDLLNAAGFDAYALHLTGRRFTWFPNETRVVCGAAFWDLFDPRRDFLALPEPLGETIAGLPGKKVIFNKNLYHGFAAFDGKGPVDAYPYTHPSVVAAFAVSTHNEAHLRFAFPAATIYRMYASIDPERYAYRPVSGKTRKIVFVRKGPDALPVLRHMLRARALAGLNRLAEYEICFLRKMGSESAAALLGDALMLITLSTMEGLPRVVLEAMSCGCIVGCYGAGPLREILPCEYGFEPEDLVGLARHVEAVTNAFPDGLDAWAPAIARGRATAAAFSVERQRRHLIEAWRQILEVQR